MKYFKILLSVSAITFGLLIPTNLYGQSFLNKLKEKSEKVKKEVNKVKNQVEQITDGSKGKTQPKKENSSDNSPVQDDNNNQQNNKSLGSETSITELVGIDKGPFFNCSVGASEYDYIVNNVKGGKKIVQRSDKNREFIWYDFNDGLAPVYDGGWFYFVNPEGDTLLADLDIVVTPYRPYTWPKFDQGRTLIMNRAGEGIIINKKGEIIKNLGKVKSVFGFENGIGGVVKPIDNVSILFYYIDLDGNEIFPNAKIQGNVPVNKAEAHMLFQSPSEGMMAYPSFDSRTKKILWGFLNTKDGSVAIKPNYPKAGSFHNGVAVVKEQSNGYMDDGKWIYIDKTGNKLFSKEFRETPKDFTSNYISVKALDGTRYIFCKDGSIFLETKDREFSPFNSDGYTICTYRNNKDERETAVFKLVEEEKDDKVIKSLVNITKISGEIFPDGCIQDKDGKIYYKSSSALIPLHPLKGTENFIIHRPFSNGYAVTKWGWVDENGNYIIRMIPK